MERLTINLPDEPNYIPDENTIHVSDEFGAKCYIGEAIDKLTDYEDAEEQGLLVRLPCKVGDEVYTISPGQCDKRNSDTCDTYCDGWNSQCEDYKGRWKMHCHPFRLSNLEYVGKFVFLTYEAAQKALEGKAE